MYVIICTFTVLVLVITGGNANTDKLQTFLACSGSQEVSLSNLNFTLFNRDNAQEGILLNEQSFNQVDPKNLTTFIIHGWNQNSNTGWIKQMKDVYLIKSADNIIVPDWSSYSGAVYPDAACFVKPVGVLMGDLIYNLTKIGVDVKKLQINGMSLGAHVAGAAGERIYNLINAKISRINGLDAAGPEFLDAPISERLDATDADFVQGIHTNGGQYGYASNYGTIDFQVNYITASAIVCGVSQSGCPLNPGVPMEPGSVLPYLMCDHLRSVVYYIESINSDNFIGKECPDCFRFATACKTPKRKTIMGENCPRNETGVRYLNVNSISPFAQG